MTGPDEGALAGRGHLRAAHADRERVVASLKAAFVQGRLDTDELGARVGQALAARTYAELAALTADLPAPGSADAGLGAAEPGAAGLGAAPARKPARTLARAALRSGICLLVAVALAEGAFLANQPFLVILAGLACIAASGFLWYGILDAWEEQRARRRLAPRSGQRRRGRLEDGRPGGIGHAAGLPGARADRTRTDLSVHRPGPGRAHPSGRGTRVRPDTGLVPGAG
jgi:hypothetical protein